MRSSRVARQVTRIVGAAAVSALLFGAVSAAPADAARNIKGSDTTASTQARNI